MSVTIEVANVGPIRQAELTVGDLNVLIGENNTGKTFFATIVHRVLTSRTDAFFPGYPLDLDIPNEINEYVEAVVAIVRRRAEEQTPDLLISDDLRVWADSINQTTLRRLGDSARKALSYAYKMSSDLLQRQQVNDAVTTSHIRITNASPYWRIEIPFGADPSNSDITVDCPDPTTWLTEVFNRAGIERYIGHLDTRWPGDKERAGSPEKHIEEFSQYVLFMRGDTNLFGGWPNDCLHLPSERGGIMQGYRAIASAALTKSTLAGIEPIKIEPLGSAAS